MYGLTYKWARDLTLKLINQYTMAGAPVAMTYNCQADYLKKIPDLLNEAIMYVSTTIPGGRIRALEYLQNMSCDEDEAWYVYRMPAGFFALCGNGLIRMENDTMQHLSGYKMIATDQLAVPKSFGKDLMVEYFRYPFLLSDDPSDNDPLDNRPDVLMTVPYYVAAHLVREDDAYAYQSLMNEFETRITRLAEVPHAEAGVVEDAYNFFGG